MAETKAPVLALVDTCSGSTVGHLETKGDERVEASRARDFGRTRSAVAQASILTMIVGLSSLMLGASQGNTLLSTGLLICMALNALIFWKTR